MPTNVLSAAELAHLVHAALGEVPSCSPLLVLVVEEGGGLAFLVPPPELVAGRDLVDQAVGVVAPPETLAVAMAAAGRAWPAASDARGEDATDVVVAHALLRSGSAATYVTGDDGPLLLDERGTGLVPDLCRRVLGQPTEPPRHETDRYVVARWLDAVLEAAGARPGRLGWADVAALHPGVVGEGEAAAEDLGWMEVAVATARFSEAVPWAVLRRRFEAEGPPAVAEAAGWFDDGSYSRWVLSSLPTVPEALAALEQLLPVSVLHQVQAAVALGDELVQPVLDDEEALWDEDDDPFDDLLEH